MTNNFNRRMDLKTSGILNPNEEIRTINKAGEGNMNLVFRIETNQRCIILKQAQPFVVKYPTIAAPIERIFTEAAFYQAIKEDPLLADMSPQILKFNSADYALVMEDLGEASDFTWIYEKSQIEESSLKSFLTYLTHLHQIRPIKFPSNEGMKSLNHEHIFSLPFEENNGIELNKIQPGLQNLARIVHLDSSLKSKVRSLGLLYLERTETLIHGDFYPGSWLKTPSGLKVIDPEFGYLGFPEFDLAVLFAHLKLAQIKVDEMNYLKKYYTNPIDYQLIRSWEGVELIRRLIGVAQLPLSLNLKEKEKILTEATKQIQQP